MELRPFSDPSLYVNRELSWLHFNRRVLEEALRADLHPLLERVKFLAIFSSNLDEYFMIRVAGIENQLEAHITDRTIDGHTPAEQLAAIRAIVQEQLALRHNCFTNDLLPALKAEGIEFVRVSDLTAAEQHRVSLYFRKEIYPLLTPLAFDTGHPFPFMSNQSLNLAIELEDEEKNQLKFARVKVPALLPRILHVEQMTGSHRISSTTRLVWIEDVVASNLAQLFPEMRIVQAHLFRLIRNADIEIEEDEAGDLLKTIEEGIRSRRYGNVVRLDIAPTMPQAMQELLINNLGIQAHNVYASDSPPGLDCLMELLALDRPDLKDEPFTPANPLTGNPRQHNIFNAIKKKDRLLYHPYDSFQPVVELVEQAAADPNVLSIKQTLYRVGSNSPVVRALMKAAEAGKQVAVLVELKARFDEGNNIVWARALEDVGVHVAYGLPGYKIHAKLTLVVRREQHKLKRYLHLGTGNYNPSTGKLYTDYSFFTANEELANDVAELFNALTGYSKYSGYQKLLVSPLNTRSKIIEMIEREIAWQEQKGNGRIVMKMNSLVDPKTIRALYNASCKGVRIELIVRGICCLKPGIANVSENIRVVSIIGRFLEHSRAYYFFNGANEELYLGSADLMPRNLDDRVETLFPVLEPTLIQRVLGDLELMLADNVKAWQVQPDGSATLIQSNEAPINSQATFMAKATPQRSRHL
uniref:Polyphosphate kinase n=1 Tax=Chlorobium chlorochromatii (strain CaD3) TaxID=340177 RepID=Q3ATH1_CHLCH